MEVILEEVTRFQNFATVDLRDLVAILEKVPAKVPPPVLLQHAAVPICSAACCNRMNA